MFEKKNAENAGDGLASPKGESSLLSEAVVSSLNATEQESREKWCLESLAESERERG